MLKVYRVVEATSDGSSGLLKDYEYQKDHEELEAHLCALRQLPRNHCLEVVKSCPQVVHLWT